MKMNQKLTLLAFGVAGGLCVGGFNAQAELEVGATVSISATADFEAPLTECGSWVEVGTYGHCWRPTGVVVGWRPYCDGHWEWTDCGWYWVSDERWAWACYHYGTWVIDPGFGWVWVPGVEWGPAWVSWRSGGGYVGWAPLAPRHATIVSANFVFVEDAHIRDRHSPSTVIVNNTTIINKTTIINNGSRREERTIEGGRKSVVINEGPGVATIEKASGKKVEARPIVEVDRQTSIPAQVKRVKGKAVEKRDEPKAAVQPAPRANENPAPVPDKKSPNDVERGKQIQPGKERSEDKPTAPVPVQPSPKPAPEPKAPGADRQPDPGGKDGAGSPPPQRPQNPPAGNPHRPPDKGHDKGGHEKQEKHEKD